MSVSFQRHVLITHRVATGTDAIKENRTAAVLAETVLMGVTIFRKTLHPLRKAAICLRLLPGSPYMPSSKDGV